MLQCFTSTGSGVLRTFIYLLVSQQYHSCCIGSNKKRRVFIVQSINWKRTCGQAIMRDSWFRFRSYGEQMRVYLYYSLWSSYSTRSLVKAPKNLFN